jgi:SH3-like domain-containing protein
MWVENGMLSGSRRNIGYAAVLLLSASPAIAQDRKPPYWASIAAGDAMMRTGPGGNYPAVWRYRRADLPVRVVQIHTSWRKIREPDGTQGWMAVALMSARRTAIVTGGVSALLAKPEQGARIAWRVEPGVVGRIDRCSEGWCRFDAKGKRGYIRTAHLWGVDPNEELE